MPKPFYALSDATIQELTELFKLKGATYDLDPRMFSILAADYAYATISTVGKDEETNGLEMLMVITFVNNKKNCRVRVLTDAILKDGKVSYYLPVNPTEINDMLIRNPDNVTIIVYDEAMKREAVIEGGDSMVTSFLKAMSDYGEALQEAIAKFGISVQELERYAEHADSAEALKQIEIIQRDAADNFSKLFRFIGQLAEVYAKISDKAMQSIDQAQ